MKLKITCWALLLFVCGGMTPAIKAQDMMNLTQKQQCLSALAGLEAKGDLVRLAQVADAGLEAGIPLSALKEALSQLYAYTGFPRSLNALGALQRVVAERQAAGRPVTVGDDGPVLPPSFNALATGTAVQTRLSGSPFDYSFVPRTDYYLKAHLFGDIFAGLALTESEREIVTVSAIAALPGCEPQLSAHVKGALNMGVKADELRSLPAVLAAQVDAAAAARATRAIAEVLGDALPAPDEPDFSVWPKGDFNAAYAQYFIGRSYLAPLDAANGGPVNVTFEPRCRNNWHIHHHSVQVLVCVSGRGWYVEQGKEPLQMTPGTVVAIPEGVKHWHGAARDSWFQHLTYTTKVEEGARNEWLEPVPDAEYDRLP